MHTTHDQLAARLSTAPRRGPTLSFLSALVLVPACLPLWAQVQLLVFSRSDPGTHFGEGRITLALAALGISAAAATVAPHALYALPVIGAAAPALSSSKYSDVAAAFPALHGFGLASASVGVGLLLALAASAALLCASLLAVLDRHAARLHGVLEAKES